MNLASSIRKGTTSSVSLLVTITTRAVRVEANNRTLKRKSNTKRFLGGGGEAFAGGEATVVGLMQRERERLALELGK